jgi:hypothetical protein
MFSFDRLKYSKIPIWENQRRIALLENFIEGIKAYYNVLLKPRYWAATELTDKEQEFLATVRTELSQGVPVIHSLMYLAKVHTTVVGGGYRGQIDMLENVTRLDQIRVEPGLLVDQINQAIGTYRADQLKNWRRTFWFARLVELCRPVSSLVIQSDLWSG